MDVTLPDLSGIEVIRRIREEAPRMKVIGLSLHTEKRYIQGMLDAGASGYLVKDCMAQDMLKAIRSIMEGGLYLSPSIAGILLRHDPSSADASSDTLSPREREVLQLLASGQTTQEIGDNLHISEKTVSAHRARMMKKLNIHSIAELTKYAVREGLTTL